MKKILIALLFLLTITNLIACGNKSDSKTEIESETEEPTVEVTDSSLTAVDKKNLEGKYNLAKNIQDGVILHAFNWSYNTIKENLPYIAEAGFSAVQTSPVQHSKGYNPLNKDVTNTWWKLYQPTSFQIGDGWLGSKEELTSLCAEAKNYGIKIICDIVFNHMGNQGDGVGYDKDILKYEETIGKNPENYFRPYKESYSGRQMDVNNSLGGLPDLKTENPYIQERAYSLLKECIDCGVSGFRFDAAKHIETPSDEKPYGSDFWTNTFVKAQTYAKTTYEKDIYGYGEVLGEPSAPATINYYTSMMSVTDDHLGGTVASFAGTRQLERLMGMINNFKGNDPTKTVLWCESHDTYESAVMDEKDPVSSSVIRLGWSINANRKGATALYFARPDNALMGEVGNYAWYNQETIVVNEFHNRFIGADEEITAQGDYLVNERYRAEDNKAGVIVTNINASKSKKTIEFNVKNLKDGTYYDQLTGNEFVITNGKAKGLMGDSGIVSLYDHELTVREPIPSVKIDYESNYIYEGTSLTVSLRIRNAKKITYQIDDGEIKEISKNGKITITGPCKLTITVDGRMQTVKEINFTSAKKVEGFWFVGGIAQNLIDTKSIYAWVWPEQGSAEWREVKLEGNNAYIKQKADDYGLLLAYFEKGVVPEGQAAWETYTPGQTQDLGKPLNKDIAYSAN